MPGPLLRVCCHRNEFLHHSWAIDVPSGRLRRRQPSRWHRVGTNFVPKPAPQRAFSVPSAACYKLFVSHTTPCCCLVACGAALICAVPTPWAASRTKVPQETTHIQTVYRICQKARLNTANSIGLLTFKIDKGLQTPWERSCGALLCAFLNHASSALLLIFRHTRMFFAP